jgi:Flp pilus assembly protein TadD
MAAADNSDSSRSTGRWKWLGAVAVAAGVVAAIVFWPQDEPQPSAPEGGLSRQIEPAAETIYANPAGYVGPKKCAACHAERVHEFRTSRHYLACVAAGTKTMPEVFLSGDAEYQPPDSRVRFQMRKQGDDFVQVTLRDSPSGIASAASPISLVYGFGAGTDEVYFTWKQDRLFELPMSWLHPLQEWGTSSFDSEGKGDFSRPTNPRCVECHNTWLEHVPGTPNQYRPESLIAGVTCEVCHGPAKGHVEFHETHPDEKSPKHITQPALLSRDLQVDLCAYCHSNSLKHRQAAFSYRPGKPLNEVYRSLVTRNPEDDHVANQTSYMKLSKCFQESDTLTCTTCHNPHVAPDEQRGRGKSACMTCHQQEHCLEQPQLPEAVRANCVGCHMPKRNKIQVNFDTAGDPLYPAVPRWEHRIAVDRIARDEILLEWYKAQTGDESIREAERLAQSLAQREYKEGDRLIGEYRYLAATEAYRRSLTFLPSDAVRDKFDQTSEKYLHIRRGFVLAEHQIADRQSEEAIKTLEQLLVKKPNHAKAHGRLGTLYATKGDNEKALEHWKAVAEFDPDDAYGEGMIGWYWYLQNAPAKAVEFLLKADELEPHSFRVNYNLALAYLKLEQFSEAEKRLANANQIEPQNIQCGLMLNGLLRQRRDLTGALKVIEALSKRTSRQQPAVEVARADSQAEAGRTAAAVTTLEAILKRLNGPDIAARTEIQNRLRRLRALPSAQR